MIHSKHSTITKRKRILKNVKLAYIGKETKLIDQLFRNANVDITFKTSNSEGNSSKTEHLVYSNKYFNSGVCQLACSECLKPHVGKSVEIS
jgi:hypothetical protein